MLQAISWTTYLAGVAVLLACYYGYVILTYYRQEITAFLSRKKTTDNQTAEPATGTGSTGNTPASMEALESIVQDIDSILEQAGKEATKEQLLAQLKSKLANYDGLRQPAYRVAVFNHIVHQAKIICGVGISAADLEE